MTDMIAVYDVHGKQIESLALDLVDVQRKQISEKTFALNIRMLFQNWRQGTVASKSRGELAFSNKKPWKQKGTGRARVGSIRSPLWRKGGVIFGPQPRTRMLALNVKKKRLVFNNILFSAIDNKTIRCFDFANQQ